LRIKTNSLQLNRAKSPLIGKLPEVKNRHHIRNSLFLLIINLRSEGKIMQIMKEKTRMATVSQKANLVETLRRAVLRMPSLESKK